MRFDQAILNRIWCETLLEELSRLGVTDVCMAPGSRSTPLTLEADANPNLTLHSHFDERGLAFFALGLAKASDKPVAIIVTSGTAVANLLPAIAEAGLTREKLILLTSDRPPELIGCGANQAIVQSGIFSSHVTDVLNLPSPSVSVPLNWLLTSVDHLAAKQRQLGGALHINCPFPEPLYSDSDKSQFAEYLSSIKHWQDSSDPYSQYPNFDSQTQCAGLMSANYAESKGVVVIGSVSVAEAKHAYDWACQLGWPVLCDSQSGISSDWAHYDLWLQSKDANEKLRECDLVVQLGERLVSKRLNQWLSTLCATFSPHQYVVVSHHYHRINQSHLPQTHIISSVKEFVNSYPKPLLTTRSNGWGKALCSISNRVTELSQAQILGGEGLTELAIAVDLSARVNNRDLFLGNSLIVRLVDMLSKVDAGEVFSNRGASGIDGLVATAAGVLKETKKPMLMLVGDTSLLYDLNSLSLLSRVDTPMVIVVTNNDGGAIFDLLPVPEKQKQALYQLPHGFDFEHAALQFKLNYCQPETLSAYQTAIENHFDAGKGTLLVEVKTPPEQASKQLKQFTHLLMESLN